MTTPVVSPTEPARAVTLTPDGFDHYEITAGVRTARVEAALSDLAGNLRAAFWPARAPAAIDEGTCATWSSTESPVAQHGAALRIATGSDGHTRAVTVTRNILYGAVWVFNFHLWDTGSTVRLRPIGTVTLEPLLRRSALSVAPLPWHFCARVIGVRIEFKVWLRGEREPPWGMSSHGGGVNLPSGWVYAGRAGWYAGHLLRGDTARFTDLSAWKYELRISGRNDPRLHDDTMHQSRSMVERHREGHTAAVGLPR